MNINENSIIDKHFDEKNDIIVIDITEDHDYYWYLCVKENSLSQSTNGQSMLARKDKLSQKVDYFDIDRRSDLRDTRIKVDVNGLYIIDHSVTFLKRADFAPDKLSSSAIPDRPVSPDAASRLLWFTPSHPQEDSIVHRVNRDLFLQLSERCEPYCRKQAEVNSLPIIYKAGPSRGGGVRYQPNEQSRPPVGNLLPEAELNQRREQARKKHYATCMSNCTSLSVSSYWNDKKPTLFPLEGRRSGTDERTAAIQGAVSTIRITSDKSLCFEGEVVTHGNHAVVGGQRYGKWTPATGDKPIPYIARLTSDSDEVVISPVKTTFVEGVTNVAYSFAGDVFFAVWYPSLILLSWITGTEPF